MTYSYKGYEIDPIKGIVIGLRGKPITKTCSGYVCVYRRGWGSFSCHRAIWIAVHGEIPDVLQINHINGIKTDNRISNLELVTASENIAHAYRIGLTSAKGEANGRATLSQSQVSEIRHIHGNHKKSDLARMYGVGVGVINGILSGKTWDTV